MPACQAPQTFGCFDVELRVQWLRTKGNPLSRLDAVVDWELFRPLLDAALAKPAKGPGGRPPHDRLKMFKPLVVQRCYNLSDEQTEDPVSNRLSFQQFSGWTLADKAPDANTIWAFREALIQADVFEKRFDRFGQRLREGGLLAQPGKLVDASFVDVPRQRNPREENATIQGGGTAAAWAEQPAQQQQKDVDARWPQKNAEVHDGYLSQSMKGFYLRAIGRRRNAAAIGLINLIYHLARYEQIVRLKLLPLRAV